MDGMDARLVRLTCDIAGATTDADMLNVIDCVSSRSVTISLKSQHDRPRIASMLRHATRDGALRQDRRTRALAMLTLREREVASLLADGLANAAIAAQLGVSVRTVRAHLESMSQKMFTRNRTELLSRLLGH